MLGRSRFHGLPSMSRCCWWLLLTLLVVLPARPLSAWGEPGHRLIAALAEQSLRPETRRAALALLAAAPVDGRNASLADIAGWADRYRDEPGSDWSRPLHFVNLSRDCRYRPLQDCRNGACVIGAIELYAGELGDAGLSAERRAAALRWLVHFVGDLHQPLHSGFADDLGGNDYQVNIDGEGSNLHRVWDRTLLAHRELSHADYLERLSRQPLPAPGAFAPARWAEQTCELIGRNAVYPDGHRIDAAYLDRQLPLAEAQLRLAAARLAMVIERALGKPATVR